jgi:hypothetical protein
MSKIYFIYGFQADENTPEKWLFELTKLNSLKVAIF